MAHYHIHYFIHFNSERDGFGLTEVDSTIAPHSKLLICPSCGRQWATVKVVPPSVYEAVNRVCPNCTPPEYVFCMFQTAGTFSDIYRRKSETSPINWGLCLELFPRKLLEFEFLNRMKGYDHVLTDSLL